VEFSSPIPLNQGDSIIPLECLYEYSLSSAELTIQLITTENKYIDIKQRDPNMVCTSGGTGTVADPIIVCDAEDLNAIRLDLDANYALGKDIDLQCFSRQDVNGWLPIGTNISLFTGSLDGQNKTISNLYINRPVTDLVGLFGNMSNGISITNIQLLDINIIGGSNVGGLIGSVSSEGEFEISNNYFSGTVSGISPVGGLIGSNFGGDINYNYSQGTVSASGQAGGLIGYASGNITNNYSIATVTSLENNAGGFIGATADDAGSITIYNNYFAGVVDCNGTYVGGFIGYQAEPGLVTIENNYWDMNTSGQLTSAGGTGKTTAEMKTQSTFTGWDFSTIWAMASSTNSGYPYLRSNPPN